jgi:UDP-2,3-diacylglucosamine pyrophosphatase LpxH
MTDRGMLIFISDIHLTDDLKGPAVSRVQQFERFFVRIAGAKGDTPATLVFVGDLFDLVRSPKWFEGEHRPYDEASKRQARVVEKIVTSILEREKPFFDAIRKRVRSGALEVRYILGNHDRLLASSPKARRAVWKALTGRDERVDFPTEMVFEDHGVLAYHGHVTDFMNSSREGGPTIGDAIGSELITRFPRVVREELLARGDDLKDVEELDDIDDVRPIYAVPAWVRQLTMDKARLKSIWQVWGGVVEGFLHNDFVRSWMRANHRAYRIDAGKKLKLLLELSTGRVMAKTHDHRLTQLYKVFQHAFDGKMVQGAAAFLEEGDHKGLRYAVNGHSHFPSMVPLGHIDGRPSAYFNTGTWRTVHQIAHHLGGRPTFLAYDAMTYLVFFPDADRIGREYEWWTGAMVSKEGAATHGAG